MSTSCSSCCYWILILAFFTKNIDRSLSHPAKADRARGSVDIGPCVWVLDRECPDPDVKFYLFTRENPEDRQYVHVDKTLEESNLTNSYFDPFNPVKIIIHGYNADMFLTPLIDMKKEYLLRGEYNLFYVDWSVLAMGPCYPSAVHNVKHIGDCVGQLVNRILDAGTDNIHLVGFSLGAQVTNYASRAVAPYRLPRITGLDPAMPLFITSSPDEKLDASDAEFVDVIHTNALVQGKMERCGHVDFYMNGGIIQPGCMAMGTNPFACSHHRAPDYYMESIRSFAGFWGWSCESYIYYLLGYCPPKNPLIMAGEDCRPDTKGMFFITTNAANPFALGKWQDLSQDSQIPEIPKPLRNRNPFDLEIDQWGKLEYEFNDIPSSHFERDPLMDNWIKYIKPKPVKGHNFTLDTMRKEENSTKKVVNVRENFMQEYKRNITRGVHPHQVFQVPHIS
ncbi:phospholipase A1 [Culicoides brevitarsis]|uniref:phospholipase A1 n=1 Tax=Culicoides brevitarsis TaxID=469753 RepID=UPI00307B860E